MRNLVTLFAASAAVFMPQAHAAGADGMGTRGRTDGEPATAEAHCCGMKGLGGAAVNVLCHPDQIALGQQFTVNVNYTTDVLRPVDLHVDVLNAKTKTYYAGAFQEFDTMEGSASLTIKMSDQASEPFLWKVFLTPRGEPFPNMLAETGFVAHLGPETVSSCQPFKSFGANPPEENVKNVDYVLLQTVPKELTPGSRARIEAEYNLVSADSASLSVALMLKGPNTAISSVADVAKKGKNKVELTLTVPTDAPHKPVYIVVTLTPEGAEWENRLAEDRTYRTSIADGRRLRVAGGGDN